MMWICLSFTVIRFWKAIEKFVDRLELSLQESGEKEVEASRIGELVMAALHAIDEVAYVRFASVYRQFKDINEFMAELKDILAKGEKRGTPGPGTA